MNKINYLLGGIFVSCMYIQLFIFNEHTYASPNKIDDCGGVFKCNGIPEELSNDEHKVVAETKVKHLNKPEKYRLSKIGKDFIKAKEICVLHAYNDPDPKRRSVGWGHQIRPGENLEHITQNKANELFEKDIEWVNDAINRLIAQHDNRFVYSQGFIDGLGSLIYNCGERGVTLTEFWDRWQKCRYDRKQPGYINKNDLNYTIAAVKTSRISAPGHVERRYDEHKLMLN